MDDHNPNDSSFEDGSDQDQPSDDNNNEDEQ